MSKQTFNESELSAALAKMADLPAFLGIKLTGVRDRGTLGDTPLHVAAIWGDVSLGRLLLDAGADTNVSGEHGYTPLHNAVEQRHFDFAKLLLARGASKDIKNENGLTPANLAQSSNDLRIQELFTN